MRKKVIMNIVIVLLIGGAVVFLCLAVQEQLPYIFANLEKNQIVRDYTEDVVEDPEDPEDPEMQKAVIDREIDFLGLSNVNDEIIGWISVPGTEIDYPICQGSDLNYYLNRNHNKQRSSLGAIFVSPETNRELEGAHTIIYGHNMNLNSSQMFRDLSKYADQRFRDQNPCIYLYTPEKTMRCEIYAAYQCLQNSSVYQEGFEMGTEDFEEWIEETLKAATYKTNISVTPIDQIVTLSTCAESGASQYRFVVHAKVLESCYRVVKTEYYRKAFKEENE